MPRAAPALDFFSLGLYPGSLLPLGHTKPLAGPSYLLDGQLGGWKLNQSFSAQAV